MIDLGSVIETLDARSAEMFVLREQEENVNTGPGLYVRSSSGTPPEEIERKREQFRAISERNRRQREDVNDSLEIFLEAVRSSCGQHAERKGYAKGTEDILGAAMDRFGIAAPHAIGEILAKLVEFQACPRKVLAEKIAGWAWRLWLSAPEDD